MTFIVFYVLFCALVGAIAKHTGRNMGAWFFIALLTSPGVGILLLLIMWFCNGNIKPRVQLNGGMFHTFEEALTFTRSNYSLDAGEDYKLASKLLKHAACRNDCDKLAIEHIG